MTFPRSASGRKCLHKYESLPIFDLAIALQNLTRRDEMDSTRAESPLVAAKDAIIIDNSYMSRDEQFNRAFELAINIIDT